MKIYDDSKMRVLFLTSPNEDYLSDSVLHGMRSLYGEDCIDFPKKEILYKNCPEQILNQVRGKGFTLYSGLLDDIELDRFNIEEKIKSGFFNLVIISDIQRQYGWFVQFRPWLTSNNTIVLDGSDTTQPYPARGLWWRRPYYWFLPKAHKKFLYFKREWTPDTHFYLWMRLLPGFIRRLLPQPKNLRHISFSIPEEKVIKSIPKKEKDFPKHIVDEEVAKQVSGSATSYAFDSESDYYTDLQLSRFGITTKRAGWDCLRHYEIAANGGVLCFRNLAQKPVNCAPFGLDSTNTILYENANELMARIKRISQSEYDQLQKKTLDWVRGQTTKNKALEVIKNFESNRRK